MAITLPRYMWAHVLSDMSYAPWANTDAALRIKDALCE